MNLSFVLLIFLFTVTSIQSQCTDCVDTRIEPLRLELEGPPGYEAWGNNLYKAYNVGKNWNNAQQTCQEDNGNLAVINSRDEAQFVRQLLVDARRTTGSEYPGGWIGLRDFDGEANWQTLTGQNLTQAGYDEWWREEDRNAKNKCGAIKTCGRFAAVSCDKEIFFVCEIEILLTSVHAE